jgi:hypothetical protein
VTLQPEPTHRVPHTPGSPAGSEPAAESAPPPVRFTYEVRIKGDMPAFLLHGLHDVDVRTTRSETILHRPAADQEALGNLLDELHDLGLTIFELHRLPDPVPRVGAP